MKTEFFKPFTAKPNFGDSDIVIFASSKMTLNLQAPHIWPMLTGCHIFFLDSHKNVFNLAVLRAKIFETSSAGLTPALCQVV
jgi:hypothetical protein